MGRPPLHEDKKDKYLTVRLSAAELDTIKEAAQAEGLIPGKWARIRLLRAAKRTPKPDPT